MMIIIFTIIVKNINMDNINSFIEVSLHKHAHAIYSNIVSCKK